MRTVAGGVFGRAVMRWGGPYASSPNPAPANPADACQTAHSGGGEKPALDKYIAWGALAVGVALLLLAACETPQFT